MILTFDDEKEDGTEYEHVIQVGMPKKRVFDAMLNIQSILEDLKAIPEEERKESEINKKQIDEIYSLIAVVLSNNMKKERISQEWVEDQMDVQQIKEFLAEYVRFCKGEANNPN